MSLSFVMEATGARWRPGRPGGAGSGAAVVRRVETDSRKVMEGDLFVAIRGDHFDGHFFIGEAFQRGAVAALARSGAALARSGAAVEGGEPGEVLEVEDTRAALGQLAAAYRRGFSIPLIAVAGSNGKTTTKDLLAAVLGTEINTLRSPASYNNAIGAPLTLLQMDSRHGAAVLELGTNHPGELAPLVRMAQPVYGVLTSIGREHLEFFADLEGVAQEEGWLAELLPADGHLFVPGECAQLDKILRRTRAGVTTVGTLDGNDWKARDISPTEGGVSFSVEASDRAFNGRYQVGLLGRHQVTNALLVMAVAAKMGLAPDRVRAGLAACPPARMRMQRWAINGVQILDDAYNANADSMRAALQTLREFPCAGRRVAVLGDMAELGAHGAAAHAEAGREAALNGVGLLFAVGRMAPITRAAAREAGLEEVFEFSAVESAAEAVREVLRPGDVVLLKASRAARLERVAEILRQAPPVPPGARAGTG